MQLTRNKIVVSVAHPQASGGEVFAGRAKGYLSAFPDTTLEDVGLVAAKASALSTATGALTRGLGFSEARCMLRSVQIQN